MHHLKRLSLTSWIFVALVAGVVLGVAAPGFAKALAPVSNIFLRLIKSIVGPLLFGTLVAGIASAGELKTMGRIALKSIVYFEVATTIALAIGLAAVNILKPGAGLTLAGETGSPISGLARPASFNQVLEHAIPQNIFESLAQNDVLQMVIFFFLFGAACSAIGKKAEPVVTFANAVAEVMFRYTRYVMYLAPFGVGAAIAVTVGSKGVRVLLGLGKLVGSLYLAEAVFVVCVLGGALAIARVPFGRFFQAARQPFLIAFSTASSEAALPIALENMNLFGVPKHIVGFVLPTGYSFNLDGSTLYLALASIFVAQAAGVNMPISTQLTMMLTLMLMSKGVAAVPRASLVILAGALGSFHLPLEGITLILGVDALMDMCRTSVNMLGNCVATAVVARWEGVALEKASAAPELIPAEP
ncbi:MAG TPA: dicarboxylate/amino acid:cation symporter [Bryobacteraceae bacterium]|jgi:proton glutamate symport protein|nr:dicarboxylate/amino acid:cation symporter [Bryobacteraceae bacterium]